MNKDEFGTSAGREPYPLYPETECHLSVANKHLDPRYETTGRIREDILFAENGLAEEMERLPGLEFEESAKFSWQISQAPYF